VKKETDKKKTKIKNNLKKRKRDVFILPQHVLKPVQSFLLRELRKLKLRKRRAEEADPFSDPSRVNDNAADDTDAAEQFGHARAEAIKKHLDKRIIQVRKALARIKIGRYGACEECGHFIDTKRLMVFPEATVCVKCEKKNERGKIKRG